MEISEMPHSFSGLILLWRRLSVKRHHERESGTSTEQALRLWITVNNQISPRGFLRKGLT